MTIEDGSIMVAFSVLGTVVASLAGAVTWMTKRHLTTLSKTVKTQAKHIITCEDDRQSMKDAHRRLKERTGALEYTLGIIKLCPESECPNKQLMRATSRSEIRPAV